MYLGVNSLSALYFHIGGYTSYCINNEIDEKLKPCFNEFHDFVANYYLRADSTAGCKNIILSENSGNEEMDLMIFIHSLICLEGEIII